MISKEVLVDQFVSLIRRASTELPRDVVKALEAGQGREEEDSLARSALDTILDNVELAARKQAPICQDTGTPVVWIRYPVGVSTRMLGEAMGEAVRQATRGSFLRPNAVETLSGKNTGDGFGPGYPPHSFRRVGRSWTRSSPDSQGRRLRERWNAVQAARNETRSRAGSGGRASASCSTR